MKKRLVAGLLVVSVMFTNMTSFAEETEQEQILDEYQEQTLEESLDETLMESPESIISETEDTVFSETDIEDNMDDTHDYQEGSSFQETLTSDFTYSQSTAGITITKYSGTEEIVEIPAEIGGVSVTSIAARAFRNCTTIKQLTIPHGVVSIGNETFKGCENLEELYYNCSLTSLGTNVFSDCSNLKTVYIGEQVTGIPVNANNDCYGPAVEAFIVDDKNPNYKSEEGVIYRKLDDENYRIILYPVGKKEITFSIPTKVTEVSQYAMSGNPNVSEIIIEGNGTVIKSSAIYNLSGLETISLNGVFSSIEKSSIESCKNLKTVNINTDISVTYTIFSDCDNISQINIGKNVSVFDTDNYGDTVTAYNVEAGNVNYCSDEGVLYSIKDKKTLVKYPMGKETVSYIIEEDTEAIEYKAFDQCKFLQEVQFKPGIEMELGRYIFYNCEKLEKVELGGGITYVDNVTIWRCNSLKTLIIGENVAEWENIENLSDLKKLEEIQVSQENPTYSSADGILFDKSGKKLLIYPSGKVGETYVVSDTVTEIGTYAFFNSQYLTAVEIPETVTTIGKNSINCTIIGIKGSAAETYAFENELSFINKNTEDEDGYLILPDGGVSIWREGLTEEITPDGNIYVVSNAAQLAWIGEQTRAGNDFSGKNIILTVNIDLESQEWVPIGDNNHPFRGNFDGRNHTINNVKITTQDHAGLFGAISSKTATQTVRIANLNISNVQIENAEYGGALSAYIRTYKGASIQIENCTISGEISGKVTGGLTGYILGGDNLSQIQISNVISTATITTEDTGSGGGIAGRLSCEDSNDNIYSGTILVEDCKSQGSVFGSNGGWIGGIVGQAEIKNQGSVDIRHCKTEGKICFSEEGRASGYAGGIIGLLNGERGSIISCVNYAAVVGRGYYSGGIAGTSSGRIEQCCNEGEVQSNMQGGVAGGIAGALEDGEISNSCNLGSIIKNDYSSTYYAGGIAAYNRGKLVNCYNIGVLPEQTAYCWAGAMGSKGKGPTEYCYYDCLIYDLAHLYASNSSSPDVPLVGNDLVNGIIQSGGYATVFMKQQGSYTTWDFSEIWEFDYNYSYGYPTLSSVKDLLEKHADPDIKSNIKKNSQFVFTVVDQDNKELEGATVTFGEESKDTEEAGQVTFDYVEESKELIVKKDGYVTYHDKDFVMNSTKEYVVPLVSADKIEEYPLSSVIMVMNGNRYELLSQMKTINLKYEDAGSPSGFQLYCTPANSEKTYIKYEILQGDSVVAESSTNEFDLEIQQFQVTKKLSVIRQTKIRLTDEEGNVYVENINLTVIDEEAVYSSLEFGDGIEFTIGEDVPILGNTTIKFEPFEVPVSVKIGEDKWRLTLNMDDEDGEGLKILKSNFDVTEKFEKVKQYLLGTNVISQNPKITVEVVGYAEGDMPFGGESIDIKGYVKVSLKWTKEFQISTFVLGFDAKGEVGATGEITINRETFQITDGSLKVGGSVGLGLFLGAGLAKVLSAGIYGDGKIGLEYYLIPEWGLDELYLSGTIKFVIRFLGKNVFDQVLFGPEKVWLYARDLMEYDVEKSTQNSGYQSAEQWLQSLGDMEVDVSSDTPAGEWTGDGYILQQTAYTDSSPVFMQVNDDMIMLFISNTLNDRNAADASVLMYSVYDQVLGVWLEPKPVEDDGTADFSPVVSGRYVAWNDSKDTLEGCTTLNQIGKQQEVSVAVYNPETHTFGNIQTLTSNQAFENNLSICETSENVCVNWSINSANDVFGMNGTNTVYFASLRDGEWETKEVVTAEQTILWKETGEVDGRVCYLYIVDENNNIEDSDGQIAYAVFPDTGEKVQLSTESMSGIYSIQGQNKILMIGTDGNIYTKNGMEGEIVQETEDNILIGNIHQLIHDDNGDITILFTQNGDNNSNAYAMFYEAELSEWTEKIALTNSEDYVEGISGGYVDGKLVFVYNQRIFDVAEEYTDGINSLLWSEVQENAVQLENLKISFFDEDAISNAELPIDVSVMNTGMSVCHAVRVRIQDGSKELLNQTVDIQILPGEEKTFEIVFNVPELADITEYELIVTPEENEGSAVSTALILGKAIYELERSLYCINGAYRLMVNVSNKGAENGDGTIEIFDYDNPSIVYESYTFTNLASDDAINYDTKIESLNWEEVSYKKIGIRVVRDGQVYSDVRSVVIYGDHNVPVEEIKLNTSSVTLTGEGKTFRLVARVLPENTTITQAIWESSNEEIVTVDSSGLITAVGEGEAFITVTIGEIAVSCNVLVRENTIVKGDVNMDGIVNLLDLMQCLNYVGRKSNLVDESIEAADVNDDGQVNLLDLMRLLNYIGRKSAVL